MACLPFSGLAPRRAQAVTKVKATVRPPYTIQPAILQRFLDLPSVCPVLWAWGTGRGVPQGRDTQHSRPAGTVATPIRSVPPAGKRGRGRYGRDGPCEKGCAHVLY